MSGFLISCAKFMSQRKATGIVTLPSWPQHDSCVPVYTDVTRMQRDIQTQVQIEKLPTTYKRTKNVEEKLEFNLKRLGMTWGEKRKEKWFGWVGKMSE